MLDNFHLDYKKNHLNYKKMSSKNIRKKIKKNNFSFPLKKTIANKKVISKKGGNPSIIEPIGSISELQKSKKRDEIRTFINSECVKKLENEQKIRQGAITDIIDKLDKLDTQDVDLNRTRNNNRITNKNKTSAI